MKNIMRILGLTMVVSIFSLVAFSYAAPRRIQEEKTQRGIKRAPETF